MYCKGAVHKLLLLFRAHGAFYVVTESLTGLRWQAVLHHEGVHKLPRQTLGRGYVWRQVTHLIVKKEHIGNMGRVRY